MDCSACHAKNPDDKKYCGDCGTPLSLVQNIPATALDERIRALLKERLADQKLIEVELTQSVLERITAWGKLLAYFAAVPLALFVVTLTVLGINKYEDFRNLLASAQNNIRPIIDDAKQRSEKLQRSLDELEPKIRSINENAARLTEIEANFDRRFAGLQGEVDQLKEEVHPSGVRPSIKYREPDLATPPKTVTVEELFAWAKTTQTAHAAQVQNSPVDPREQLVLSVTGDLYAAERDEKTGSIRVLIGPPGVSKPVHTVIVVVPNSETAALAGVKNTLLYATTQHALIDLIGRPREKLIVGPEWDLIDRPRRITATGFAQYNAVYATRAAGGAHIGVWQLSPVWRIQPL
jgi:hypothetical protein